jgi:hypothetical protein
MDVSNPHTT